MDRRWTSRIFLGVTQARVVGGTSTANPSTAGSVSAPATENARPCERDSAGYLPPAAERESLRTGTLGNSGRRGRSLVLSRQLAARTAGEPNVPETRQPRGPHIPRPQITRNHPHQLFSQTPLRSPQGFGINNESRADVWLAERFCATLDARSASGVQEGKCLQSAPATELRFGNRVSEGFL
jgi:hypothetical protein